MGIDITPPLAKSDPTYAWMSGELIDWQAYRIRHCTYIALGWYILYDYTFFLLLLKQTKYNISTILITLIVSCIYIFTPSQNLSPSLFPYSISNHWSSSPMNISVPLQTRPEPPRKNWEEEEQWEGDDTSTQEPDTEHPSRKSKPKKPDTEHPSGKSKSFKSSAHPWEHPSLLLEN